FPDIDIRVRITAPGEWNGHPDDQDPVVSNRGCGIRCGTLAIVRRAESSARGSSLIIWYCWINTMAAVEICSRRKADDLCRISQGIHGSLCRGGRRKVAKYPGHGHEHCENQAQILGMRHAS